MPRGQIYGPEELDAFIEALAECGNVRDACRKTGLSRSALYEYRDAVPTFAERWVRAKTIGAEGLEDEARRRAYEGIERPIVSQGSVIGSTQEYSDVLLIFLLKGAMPDKYKDRVQSDVNVTERELSDTERAARVAAIIDAARARGSGSAAAEPGVDAPAGAAE